MLDLAPHGDGTQHPHGFEHLRVWYDSCYRLLVSLRSLERGVVET